MRLIGYAPCWTVRSLYLKKESMAKLDYLALLQSAVRQTHNCEAVYSETVHVHEVVDGQTMWKGDVEIFTLSGHAEAKRCFAWIYQDGAEHTRYVMVLEKASVDSPKMAVKSAIFFNVQPAPYSLPRSEP